VYTLATEGKNLIPRDVIQRHRNNKDVLVLTSGVFVASIFPHYWHLAIQGSPRVSPMEVHIPDDLGGALR
jgi:hypothetical protein